MIGPASTFAQNGLALVSGAFSTAQVQELLELLPELSGSAGTRNLLDFDWCRSLAQGPEIKEILANLIGVPVIATRAILFDKSPRTNWVLGWHQDTKIAVKSRIETPGYSAWSEKEGVIHCKPPQRILEASVAIRLHLDPCHAENGPLRVIPGSHLKGLQSQPPSDEQAVTCQADAGDVLAMRPLLWHASSKSESPNHRRVIHIEYCSAQLDGTLEWAFAT